MGTIAVTAMVPVTPKLIVSPEAAEAKTTRRVPAEPSSRRLVTVSVAAKVGWAPATSKAIVTAKSTIPEGKSRVHLRKTWGERVGCIGSPEWQNCGKRRCMLHRHVLGSLTTKL